MSVNPGLAKCVIFGKGCLNWNYAVTNIGLLYDAPIGKCALWLPENSFSGICHLNKDVLSRGVPSVPPNGETEWTFGLRSCMCFWSIHFAAL